MDVNPGWTVTILAPISDAAATVARVSLTDASLSLSLIAAGFQSQMGACIWNLSPLDSRAFAMPRGSLYTLWSASENISQRSKCSDTGPTQSDTGLLLKPVQETPIRSSPPRHRP